MPRNVISCQLLRFLVISDLRFQVSGFRSTPCHCTSPTYGRVLAPRGPMHVDSLCLFCRAHPHQESPIVADLDIDLSVAIQIRQ